MNSSIYRSRNFVFLLMQFAFERGIAALAVFGIAYLNGPETFGRAAMLLAVPMAAAGAMRALTDLVLREAHTDGRSPASLLAVNLVAGAAAFALALASWWGIERVTGLMLSPVVVVFAALIPILVVPGYIADGILLHRERYDLSLWRKLVAGLCGIAGAALAYGGGLANSMIVIFFFGQSMGGTIFALIFVRAMGGPTSSLELFGAARLSAEMIGASLIFQALPRATELLAGIVLGPAAAAILRIGIQIVETISGVLFSALNTVIINSRDTIGKAIQPQDVVVKHISFALIFFLPVYLMILFLPGLAPVEKYYGDWLGLVPTLQALGMLGIVHSLDFPVRAGIMRFGRPKALAAASAAGGVFAVVITGCVALAAPTYLALGYVIASAALMLSSLWFGRAEFGLSTLAIAPLVIISVAIYLTSFALIALTRALEIAYFMDLFLLIVVIIILFALGRSEFNKSRITK